MMYKLIIIRNHESMANLNNFKKEKNLLFRIEETNGDDLSHKITQKLAWNVKKSKELIYRAAGPSEKLNKSET